MLESRNNKGVEATGERSKECVAKSRRKRRTIGKRVASVRVGRRASWACEKHLAEARAWGGIQRKTESRVGGVYVFQPKIRRKEDFKERRFRLLRRSDVFSVLTELGRHISRTEVNKAYKRKAQKVRLVDLGELDKSKPSRVLD